jgi:hypothetical protein
MAATPPRVRLAAVALLLTLAAPCLHAYEAHFRGDSAIGTPRKLGQDFLMSAMSETLQGATRHLTVSARTVPLRV